MNVKLQDCCEVVVSSGQILEKEGARVEELADNMSELERLVVSVEHSLSVSVLNSSTNISPSLRTPGSVQLELENLEGNVTASRLDFSPVPVLPFSDVQQSVKPLSIFTPTTTSVQVGAAVPQSAEGNNFNSPWVLKESLVKHLELNSPQLGEPGGDQDIQELHHLPKSSSSSSAENVEAKNVMAVFPTTRACTYLKSQQTPDRVVTSLLKGVLSFQVPNSSQQDGGAQETADEVALFWRSDDQNTGTSEKFQVPLTHVTEIVSGCSASAFESFCARSKKFLKEASPSADRAALDPEACISVLTHTAVFNFVFPDTSSRNEIAGFLSANLISNCISHRLVETSTKKPGLSLEASQNLESVAPPKQLFPEDRTMIVGVQCRNLPPEIRNVLVAVFVKDGSDTRKSKKFVYKGQSEVQLGPSTSFSRPLLVSYRVGVTKETVVKFSLYNVKNTEELRLGEAERVGSVLVNLDNALATMTPKISSENSVEFSSSCSYLVSHDKNPDKASALLENKTLLSMDLTVKIQ